jgi:hypothetical protein
MSDKPRDNLYFFRRLKWGDPKRLRGMKAIGLAPHTPREGGPMSAPPPRANNTATLGLIVAGVAALVAVGLGAFGMF